MQHPRHDAVVTAVASWYREASPALRAMGYAVQRRPYGWVQRHAAVEGVAVTLAPAEPDDVPARLAAIRADLGSSAFLLRVEGRPADARLHPALEAAGCVAIDAEAFLAFVGDPPDEAPLPGVALEDVDVDGLETWARTKLAGFAGDQRLTTRDLATELSIRAAELRGPLRLRLARVAGAPAGVLAAYAGDDWLLFSLATLPAYREAGIARVLLADAVRRASADGARSVLINADPADWPGAWYARFGFEDEVYWRRTYRVP